MGDIGYFTACLAWFLGCLGIVTGIVAGKKQSTPWLAATRNATVLVAVCAVTSLGILGYLFVTDNYTNQYVWQHSNASMPWGYKITAIWGGMDGSMLLWATMVTISGAIVAWRTWSYPRVLMPWVLATVNSTSVFFFTLVVFLTNPFRYLKDVIPPVGNGLNPLLQNPYMAIHPPMLYLGFTTFAIPFAFCIGALLSGHLSNDWIRLTRRWTLIAWGFLTAGIVMGGHWAYLELGWGGFWAWDPVENASFLPWLTGTAFLHSVMVQERKNMLKLWNIWLIVLTYGLTVFGTFLTRSGVVQSVHAFASTDIGWVFLLYLALLVLFVIGLCVYRKAELRSERQIESLLSREAAFLLNNLLFLSICFATLWGVMFPVLSEAVTGTKQAVGIPFFNTINVPLFLLLLLLMGVGPLIAWRRASLKSVARTFVTPFITACVVSGALVWAGITDYYALISYGLCWFVVMTVMSEFHRGLGTQKVTPGKSSMSDLGERSARLFKRHRIRYGGYLIHLGVVVATIGITASMAHKKEEPFSIGPGETYSIGRFTLALKDIREESASNYAALVADVELSRSADGKVIDVLSPELRHYQVGRKETTTEVALRMGLREDVYLVLAGLDNEGRRAAFKVFINPLQVWLWIGTVIMLIGTGVVLVPRAVSARQEASAGAKQSVRA